MPTKTIKFPISYHEDMQMGDRVLSFQEFCREAWDCQNEARSAMNAASSAYKVHVEREMTFFDENGSWPGKEEYQKWYTDENGKPISVETMLNHAGAPKCRKLASEHFYGDCHAELSKWTKSKKEFISGRKTYPNYRSNHPILIKKGKFTFQQVSKDSFTVSFGIFSKDYAKSVGLKNREFVFECNPSNRDHGTKAILKNIVEGNYDTSTGHLVYDFRVKKWVFCCSYSFKSEQKSDAIEPNRVLGVDLGVNYAAYCAVSDSLNRFSISGDEIKEFRRRVEKRRISKLKALPYQSGGKVGHGTKCRLEKAYEAEDAIARFRDTKNKQYAKAIVDFALKNGCSVIQLENLSGIRSTAPVANSAKKKPKKSKAKANNGKQTNSEEQISMFDSGFFAKIAESEKEVRKKENRMLGNWTFYDLRSRIESKAAECGIVVSVVDPAFTSQRCSFCGYISAESRPPTGEAHKWFTCVRCGRRVDADYNAARNLSIAGIESIISEQLKLQRELEEKLKSLQ